MITPSRAKPGDEACARCGAALEPKIAYCPECGQRTRYATRMVRYWARLEVLFIVLFALLVVGFTIAYYIQR